MAIPTKYDGIEYRSRPTRRAIEEPGADACNDVKWRGLAV